MEEHVKHVLEAKAIEVSNYLDSGSVSHQYRFISYGINFTLWEVQNQHILTLSYSPNKNRWKPYSTSDWVNDIVIPLIQPFLGGTQPSISKQKASATSNEQKGFSAEFYFTGALEHLRTLEPFAAENIDFSIIGDLAQRGVRLILNNPRFTHLNRQALEKMLEQPQQSNFSAIKEYLHQCLKVCGVTEN